MKFKILFIFTILTSLVCSSSIVGADSGLKAISIKLEKDVIKQGETTKVTVAVKNTFYYATIQDLYFFLRLSSSDVDDIEIKGYDQKKDKGDFTDYYIDATDTALKPGEIKTAVYVINAIAPRKEEYTLIFGAMGDKKIGSSISTQTVSTEENLKIYLKIELAPDYYLKKAEEYFKSDNYENAKEYAEKAKEIYINSGNNEGILNCDKIILQSEKLIEADFAYIMAKNRMGAKDFREAMSNAEASLKIYNEIDLIDLIDSELISERVSELELIIEETNKTITVQEYFSNAKKYLDSGDYEKAKEYAEKAKEIYLERDNYNSVLKCNSIIDKSESHVNRYAMISEIGYAVGIITLLIFIFLLYKMYR